MPDTPMIYRHTCVQSSLTQRQLGCARGSQGRWDGHCNQADHENAASVLLNEAALVQQMALL